MLRKNVQKSQQVASQQQQQAQKKNNKGGKPTGILVNKNEPVVVKATPVEEVTNHFEEIHPKDAVEIQRLHPDEKKHNKRGKPVKETPPVSPKNQPVVAPPKPVEEKPSMKKKRNEVSASTSAVDGFVSDDITPLIRELTKADLSKNQIQMLIDFLLNKQADSRYAVDPSEWSEGKSDLVQKLKRQLQEAEAKLRNERDALFGTQTKLKELRLEFNNEKIQANAQLKAMSEQMHNGKLEVKNLQAELHFLNEKHNQEKQNLSLTYKQLHAKYTQLQESLKTQEAMPSVQQLENDNQLLHQELSKKNQQIIDLNSYVEESRKKEVSFV
jgi:ribosome-binding protein 1